MNSVRAPHPRVRDIVPYDPKYLPARAMLSANENPDDVPAPVRDAIARAIGEVALNRYPDPLANDLRDALAEAYGLQRGNVLVGNGGDELLLDVLMCWGGPGRTLLNVPPTFSVYAADARLTGTQVVDVARTDDFAIDEEAVLAAVAEHDVDIVVVCSPNNPTGDVARREFVEQLLDATDALVLMDEAYGEFSGQTTLDLLERHRNLVVLHTFSKAYSLAGVRLGFVLAHEQVITELVKVRQPYSVDAVSQAIGLQVARQRQAFDERIACIVQERERMLEKLRGLPGVEVWPSQANYLFFRVKGHAQGLWQHCYDNGVLIRDFSTGALTQDCFRVTVATRDQNDQFLACLGTYLQEGEGR